MVKFSHFHLSYAIEVNLIFVLGFSYRNIKKKGNAVMYK